jgi:hypothetical protein
MSDITAPLVLDPVVIYDQLLEARSRLLGAYNAAESDDRKVVAFAQELADRVDAVDVDDLDAQRELMHQLELERAALVS